MLNSRQKFYKKLIPPKEKLLPLGRASPSPTQLNSDALFWSKVTTCLSPKRWFNLSKLFRSGITEAAKGTSNKSRNSWDLGPMPQPQCVSNRTELSWVEGRIECGAFGASNCDQHRIETESIWIHTVIIHISYGSIVSLHSSHHIQLPFWASSREPNQWLGRNLRLKPWRKLQRPNADQNPNVVLPQQKDNKPLWISNKRKEAHIPPNGKK